MLLASVLSCTATSLMTDRELDGRDFACRSSWTQL